MYKKILLLVLGLGSILFFWMRSDIGYALINTGQLDFLDKNFGPVHDTLLFFPIAFVCALIAALAPNAAFNFWYYFALTTIPLITIITFLLSLGLHHTGGGFINIDNDIDTFLILLMYTLFSLVSAIQIIRGALSRKN